MPTPPSDSPLCPSALAEGRPAASVPPSRNAECMRHSTRRASQDGWGAEQSCPRETGGGRCRQQLIPSEGNQGGGGNGHNLETWRRPRVREPGLWGRLEAGLGALTQQDTTSGMALLLTGWSRPGHHCPQPHAQVRTETGEHVALWSEESGGLATEPTRPVPEQGAQPTPRAVLPASPLPWSHPRSHEK